MRAALSLLVASLFAACATTAPATPPWAWDPESSAMVDTVPSQLQVWDGRTGEALTRDAIMARLDASEVVLVGEEHGNADFQRTQLQVLRTVALLGVTTLAVEWFRWPQREALQRLSGLPPSESLPRVYHEFDWPNTWGHDFKSYAPILAYALQHLVVEPLNARRELSRAVAAGGPESVPAELRAELPPLDSGTAAHRAWFANAMGVNDSGGHGHAMPPDKLERYYLAQLVWDETMAMHIRELAPRGRVVACAGLGHTERALGIAARLGTLRTLIVRPVADAADALAHAHEADFPDREADLLWAFPAHAERSSGLTNGHTYPRSTNTSSR